MKYCSSKSIFTGLFLLLQVLDLGHGFFLKYKQQELELLILGSVEKMIKMITNFNYPENGGVRCLREEFADKVIETIQSSVSCQIHRFGPIKKIFIHNGIILDRFDDCAQRAKSFVNDILLQNARLRDCDKKWSKNYSIGVPLYNKKIYYITFNDGLLVSKKVSGAVARDPIVPAGSMYGGGASYGLGNGNIIVRKRRDTNPPEKLDPTGIYKNKSGKNSRSDSTYVMFPWYPTKHALSNRRVMRRFSDPWSRFNIPSSNPSSNQSTRSGNSFDRITNWVRDQMNNHCQGSIRRSDVNQVQEEFYIKQLLNCFIVNENVQDDTQLEVNLEKCIDNVETAFEQSSNNVRRQLPKESYEVTMKRLKDAIYRDLGKALSKKELEVLKNNLYGPTLRKEIILDLRKIRRIEAENVNNSASNSNSNLHALKNELKMKICQHMLLKSMKLMEKIDEKLKSKGTRRFEHSIWYPPGIPTPEDHFPPLNVRTEVGTDSNPLLAQEERSSNSLNSHRNRVKELDSDTWLRFDNLEELKFIIKHFGVREPKTLRGAKNIELNVSWLPGSSEPKVNIYGIPNQSSSNLNREGEPTYYTPFSKGKKLKFDSHFSWLPKSRGSHNDQESNRQFPFGSSTESEEERGVLCLLKSPKNQYIGPYSVPKIEFATLKCIIENSSNETEESNQQKDYLLPDPARNTDLLEKLKQYGISNPFIGPIHPPQQPHFPFTTNSNPFAPLLNQYPHIPLPSSFQFGLNPNPLHSNTLPSHSNNNNQNPNALNPLGSISNQKPFGSDQDQDLFGSNQHKYPFNFNQDKFLFGFNDNQNPFESNQNQNPFGPNQIQNPFESNQNQNPFESNQNQNPLGSNKNQNPFGFDQEPFESNRDEEPKELFRDQDSQPQPYHIPTLGQDYDEPSGFSHGFYPKIKISLLASGRRKKRSLATTGPQLRQSFDYDDPPMMQPNTLWFDRPSKKLTTIDPVFMTENDIFRRSLRNLNICENGMQVGIPGQEVKRIELCGGEMQVGTPETQSRRSKPKTLTKRRYPYSIHIFHRPHLG